MKHFILVSFLLLSISCSRNYNTLPMKGTLTGPDLALCPCCGGIILTLDNDPGNFRVDTLPFMSIQKLYSLDFPKRIEFDFSSKDTCAGIVRFKVTSFFIGGD